MLFIINFILFFQTLICIKESLNSSSTSPTVSGIGLSLVSGRRRKTNPDRKMREPNTRKGRPGSRSPPRSTTKGARALPHLLIVSRKLKPKFLERRIICKYSLTSRGPV